jgi:hypothetical protein
MSPSKSFHINTAHPWITISTKTDKSGPDRFLQFTKKWSVTIQKKKSNFEKKNKNRKNRAINQKTKQYTIFSFKIWILNQKQLKTDQQTGKTDR